MIRTDMHTYTHTHKLVHIHINTHTQNTKMLPIDPGTSKIFIFKVENGPGSALSYTCPQASASPAALMTDLQQDFSKHRMELSRVTTQH